MKIVALDLGKFNTMACIYQAEDGSHEFRKVSSSVVALHDLLGEVGGQRVVIEVGSMAGWVKDLAEAMGFSVEVANVNAEAWRWKQVRRKTDRDDALKLARMSCRGELPTVYLPSRSVRQWRGLIGYRQELVARRTQVKNRIRSILTSEGRGHASGKKGWTEESVESLRGEALELGKCSREELWRGMLQLELVGLEQVEGLIVQVESKLEALAQADKRVSLLRTIPGVGPRLAELVVAVIDDPKRFGNRKQVGSYAGLTPRQFASGTMMREGRISGRGNRLLRALLVEVGWLMQRWNSHFREVFSRVSRGMKKRRKVAVVAVARRLLITCWAMLRDGTRWRGLAGSECAKIEAAA